MRHIVGILALAAVMAFLACGCGRRGVARLEAVEALMEAQPYPSVALDSLAAIDSAEVMGGYPRALYDLLWLELNLKNYREVADLSRIDGAIATFESLGDSRHLADAWHYKGLAMFEAGDYASAMNAFSAALDIAGELSDTLRMARACEVVGDIYSRCGQGVQACRWRRRTVGLYHHTDKTLNYYYALVELAADLAQIGEPAASVELLDSISFVASYGDPVLTAQYELSYAAPLAALGKTRRAKSILMQAAQNPNSRTFSEEDVDRLVGIYLAEGRVDSARMWLDYGVRYGRHADGPMRYKTLGEINRAEGDWQAAVENMERYYEAYDSAYAALADNTVQQARTDYYRDTVRRAGERSLRQRYYIVAMCAVVAVMAVGLLYLVILSRARRAEIINKMLVIRDLTHRIRRQETAGADISARIVEGQTAIEQLSSSLSSQNERNTQLRELTDELWETTFAPVDRLCDEYFNKRDSKYTKELLYTSIEDEIRRLRSKEGADKLVRTVDLYHGGLLTRAFEYFGPVESSERFFVALMVAGVSPRAICLMSGMSLSNFYTRRRRIIDKVAKSAFADRLELLDCLD